MKATAKVQVPFHDVDVLHIAWHGHYLKYFEVARTVLMQKVGLDWPVLKEQGIAMPIVEAHVQYRKPLLYNQQASIEASIEEYAYAELVVKYRVLAAEPGPREKVLTTGWTRQVYLTLPAGTSCFIVPDFVRERLEQASKGDARA